MCLSNIQNRLRSRTRMQLVKLKRRLRDRQVEFESALSLPRAKSAPRGSKSTTFAWGKIQVSNPQTMIANPIGEPSVSPFQYPTYLWLQAVD